MNTPRSRNGVFRKLIGGLISNPSLTAPHSLSLSPSSRVPPRPPLCPSPPAFSLRPPIPYTAGEARPGQLPRIPARRARIPRRDRRTAACPSASQPPGLAAPSLPPSQVSDADAPSPRSELRRASCANAPNASSACRGFSPPLCSMRVLDFSPYFQRVFFLSSFRVAVRT